MKAAALFLAILCLCACKNTEKPKVVTVAFNGWHGQEFLKQGCIVLQRDYERVRKMSAQEYVTLMTLTDKHYMPCLVEPRVMNSVVENQLLSAFAANPQCQGVSFSQGYYGPKDSTQEAGQKFLDSNWRLSLDLTPSAETGDVSLADSQWTLNPRTLSGNLENIEKAATDICTIVKGQGGQM
ncbi:MAG TPA: hypothetical protein VHA33_08795 [Candidatus Angelobacter sp.]|jgi:hypothetical protein|nr:hypothetical protein [Candidatus Angelobacter sp.]